jgi:hypothetical protein
LDNTYALPFKRDLKFPLIALPVEENQTGYFKAEFYLLYFQNECEDSEDYIEFSVSFGSQNLNEQKFRFDISDFDLDNDGCKKWNKAEFNFEANQNDLNVTQ